MSRGQKEPRFRNDFVHKSNSNFLRTERRPVVSARRRQRRCIRHSLHSQIAEPNVPFTAETASSSRLALRRTAWGRTVAGAPGGASGARFR
jgi:hypothetical protein